MRTDEIRHVSLPIEPQRHFPFVFSLPLPIEFVDHARYPSPSNELNSVVLLRFADANTNEADFDRAGRRADLNGVEVDFLTFDSDAFDSDASAGRDVRRVSIVREFVPWRLSKERDCWNMEV